jgi:hypothetical protein
MSSSVSAMHDSAACCCLNATWQNDTHSMLTAASWQDAAETHRGVVFWLGSCMPLYVKRFI